jgi:DNA-binding MarR family transcriptional regulator
VPTATNLARAASELRIVLGQLVRRLRAENTLPIQQLAVLSRLEREGPRTTSALAAAERMRPQSMAETLAELKGAGLVARHPDPGDRRQLIVELTGGGRELVASARCRREGWLERAIAEELAPDEQELLLRVVPLLRRLLDA